MKILLVDDHQMVRLGLKSYLELQEDIAEVSEAVNGKEGIEQALASRPDVIIMDIVMPEMNTSGRCGMPARNIPGQHATRHDTAR